MRGGLVAVGIILVIVGLSWGVILPYLGTWLPFEAWTTNWLYVSCILPIVLIIVGGMVFIVGLVAKRGVTGVPPPPTA